MGSHSYEGKLCAMEDMKRGTALDVGAAPHSHSGGPGSGY